MCPLTEQRRRNEVQFVCDTDAGLSTAGGLQLQEPRQPQDSERRSILTSPPESDVVAEEWGLRPSWGVSLKCVQEEAQKALVAHHDLPKPVVESAGVNKVMVVLFEDNDVILGGDRDPRAPPLDLENLTIALRNAFGVSRDYSGAIGCTIDPRPGPDPWKTQDVKVFGGPRGSRMAALDVQIDYELKRVGAGYAIMPGVLSSFDLNPISTCSGGKYEAAHRYWFTSRYPPAPRYLQDQNSVWVHRPIQVQLLTEEEYLNRRGERVGGAAPKPGAAKFAQQVTELLATDDNRLAAELRQSFRVIEIANLIHRLDPAGTSVGLLLSLLPLSRYAVPTEVPGVSRTKTETTQCGVQEGANGEKIISIGKSTQEYRGGVEARVDLNGASFSGDSSAELPSVRSSLLNSRPISGCSWRVRQRSAKLP